MEVLLVLIHVLTPVDGGELQDTGAAADAGDAAAGLGRLISRADRGSAVLSHGHLRPRSRGVGSKRKEGRGAARARHLGGCENKEVVKRSAKLRVIHWYCEKLVFLCRCRDKIDLV